MPPEVMKGKNILILGCGVTGQACARALAEAGADVTVLEENWGPGSQLSDREMGALGVELLTKSDSTALAGRDLMVVSPGVLPLHPLVSKASLSGLEVISEIELAYRMFEPTVLAVTGTNGKTTTTTLLTEMLSASGLAAMACGNIGFPLIEACRQNSSSLDTTLMVAEISSFQLHFCDRFRPKAAAVLNLSPDHRDWHGDFNSYRNDKQKVLIRQREDDWSILNADDDALADFDTNATRAWFSIRREVFGCYIRKGAIVESLGGNEQAICGVSDVRLPGKHNLSNVLAAATVALCVGADRAAVGRAVSAFDGVEHRLELAAIIGGVHYYNDSKATNPESTMAALASFDRPVVLIAGGRGKGGDLRPLFALAKEKVKAVVLLGEKMAEMAQLAGSHHIEWHAVQSMAGAVDTASALADRGDVVLLSPACASYDMFRDYKERGEAFKKAVGALAGGRLAAAAGNDQVN